MSQTVFWLNFGKNEIFLVWVVTGVALLWCTQTFNLDLRAHYLFRLPAMCWPMPTLVSTQYSTPSSLQLLEKLFKICSTKRKAKVSGMMLQFYISKSILASVNILALVLTTLYGTEFYADEAFWPRKHKFKIFTISYHQLLLFNKILILILEICQYNIEFLGFYFYYLNSGIFQLILVL